MLKLVDHTHYLGCGFMLNGLMHFPYTQGDEYPLLPLRLSYATFDLGYSDLCHI